MELKVLSCTRCGANISEHDLNEPVIFCRYCGCSFIMSGKDIDEIRVLVPVPENMSININESRFVLTYKWKSVMGIVLIIFGSFFFLFSNIWTLIAAAAGGGGFSLFGVAFIFFSLLLLYMGIAFRVNKTVIRIEEGNMSISFTPLYWPGKKSVNISEILQLFVQKKEYQNKGNTSYLYNVVALQKGNRSLKLVSMIQEPEIAKCIEQQIERYLRLKDLSIAGEYK